MQNTHNHKLKCSSDNELAFEAEIVEELKVFHLKMKLAWIVDTANGSSNLNQYDGYVKIINGFAAGATTTTTAANFCCC
jgi:hypothetical protein